MIIAAAAAAARWKVACFASTQTSGVDPVAVAAGVSSQSSTNARLTHQAARQLAAADRHLGKTISMSLIGRVAWNSDRTPSACRSPTRRRPQPSMVAVSRGDNTSKGRYAFTYALTSVPPAQFKGL